MKKVIYKLGVDDTLTKTIVKPEDEMYNLLKEGVGGLIEHYYSINSIPTLSLDKENKFMSVDFWGDDEARLKNDEIHSKVNALACLLCEGNIFYGDIILTKYVTDEEDKDSDGFSYVEDEEGDLDLCEAWVIEDAVGKIINYEQETLKKIHEEYDGKGLDNAGFTFGTFEDIDNE